MHSSKYWERVSTNSHSEDQTEVSFQRLENLEASKQEFGNYEFVVFQSNEPPEELVSSIIDSVVKADKPHSCLMILEKEDDQFKILTSLRQLELEDVWIIPIFFKQEKRSVLNNIMCFKDALWNNSTHINKV